MMKLLRADLVLTGRPGESVPDGEVLVDGSQIVHMGIRGSAPDTPGTEVTELPGCTLLPGLIDSHVHLGFDRTVSPVTRRSAESDAHLVLRMVENCRKLLSAGVTTARDLGGRDFLEVGLRDAIESGLALGPHLVVATRPITNTGGHCWYMGGEADSEDAIRRVARENLRAGADCLKIMATGGGMTPVGAPTWQAQFTADQIRVAVMEAAMRGKTIAAHAHGTEGIARAAEAGVTTIEHCSFAGRQGFAGPADVDMDVVASIADRGIYVCPTLSGVVWMVREAMGSGWLESRLSRLSLLREAGVQIVAGTDSGFMTRGGIENRMDDYVSGLEVIAAAGWDAAAVIEAATVLAAAACGVGDVTGSLDPGRRADLIAVAGNPLLSLDDLRQIRLVMVSGRLVTQTGIETVASSGARD
jgi:imidazolonepropionase-like amidohydrolase